MEIEKNWRKIPRDGNDRFANLNTQSLLKFSVFNRPEIITESWYPVISARKIRNKEAASFALGKQRFVIFRTEDGKLCALDAFCPHMGADLGNGKVVGKSLQCYFHQWEFNANGTLNKIPCQNHKPDHIKVTSYPVEEKYGFIWIYSAPKAPHPVPSPPGLENCEVTGIRVANPTLFVHHHVLMVSAIDLQHFSSVHHLDVDFDFYIEKRDDNNVIWNVYGNLPKNNWRGILSRWLFGDQFSYKTLFSGGSLVTINYGNAPHFRGQSKYFRWPNICILWGAVPLQTGVSQVQIFIVQKKAKNLIQKLRNFATYAMTLMLLTILRDDDVKAFPHMRFNPENLIDKDKSASLLIQHLNKLKVSKWSYEN